MAAWAMPVREDQKRRFAVDLSNSVYNFDS